MRKASESGRIRHHDEVSARAREDLSEPSGTNILDSTTMRSPGISAVGTWSGGRFMHFGEPVDEERLEALLRPGDGHRHAASPPTPTAPARRTRCSAARWPACRATDFCARRRDRARLLHRRARGREGLPALHRSAAARAGRLRRLRADGDRAQPRAPAAWTPSTSSCCTTPTAPATRARRVWDAMAALRDDGLTRRLGVAPGPANGFTLDLIDCLERFGDRIDWAMVILNPLEPWPGELVLDAAAAPRRPAHHPRRRLRRAVPRRRPARPRVPALRPPLVPAGRLGRARPRADGADAPDRCATA